jgi:hypothetical protein
LAIEARRILFQELPSGFRPRVRLDLAQPRGETTAVKGGSRLARRLEQRASLAHTRRPQARDVRIVHRSVRFNRLSHRSRVTRKLARVVACGDPLPLLLARPTDTGAGPKDGLA